MCVKYLIIALLATTCIVVGEKNHIMIDINHRLSLVSDEDMRIILRYSYNLSTCCNILINGKSKLIDELFKQFIKIYQYEYTIGSVDYRCQAYLLLLESNGQGSIETVKQVPRIKSTSEIIIFMDGKIENDSPIFNVTLFQHANVNVFATNGNWSLSDNFLQPRIFKRISKYSNMKRKRGVMNLQGRELQVATFYQPPFSYLSTTINDTVDGIDGELDGIEVKLFLIMAEQLNFTWRMRKPQGPYRHGRPNGETWNGGIIGQVFNKQVDLAFGEIWLEYHQYRYINVSLPWYHISIKFLVPRPKPITSYWALMKPFSTKVWITIGIVFFLQSIHVSSRAWINPNVPQRLKNYTTTLTELVGRFLGSCAPKNTACLRIQFLMWHLAGLLMVTAYSSSLAAKLTTPNYEPRIDTLQQFVENNLTWGRQGPPSNFELQFDFNDPYAKKIPERFYSETSQVERENKIKSGKYALIGTRISSIFFPENNISNADLINYRLMRESIAKYFVCYATQSWLIDSIDTIILRLIENGLVAYHLENVIRRKASIQLREVLIEHDDEKYASDPTPLMLKPLSVGFIILIVGNTIAAVIFYFEQKIQTNSRIIRCGQSLRN